MLDFLGDRKKDYLLLVDFINSANDEAARTIVHKWKGYCEPYGFAGLGLIAAKFEKAIQGKNRELFENFLVEIRDYLTNKILESPSDLETKKAVGAENIPV